VLLLVLVRKVTLTSKNGAEYHFVGAIDYYQAPTTMNRCSRIQSVPRHPAVAGGGTPDGGHADDGAGRHSGAAPPTDGASPDTLKFLMEARKAGIGVTQQAGRLALVHLPDAALDFGGSLKFDAWKSLVLDRREDLGDGSAEGLQDPRGHDVPRPSMTMRPRKPSSLGLPAVLPRRSFTPGRNVNRGARAPLQPGAARLAHDRPALTPRVVGCCGVSVEYCGDRFDVRATGSERVDACPLAL